MAEAVRQGPRSKKWNVVLDDGQIEHGGVSEVVAAALAKRLTEQGK